MKVLIAVFNVALLTTAAAWGQSAAELHARYPIVEVYQVRPSVWMTTSYAIDGQVCQMILEKRHTTKQDNKTVVDEASSFTDTEIRELQDELVPAPERGRMTGHPWLNTTISGRSIWTVDTYENIKVEVDGFLDYSNQDVEELHSKPGATTHKKPAANGSAQAPSNDKLIIVITWPKRQCASEPQSAKTARASQ